MILLVAAFVVGYAVGFAAGKELERAGKAEHHLLNIIIAIFAIASLMVLVHLSATQ